MESRSEAPHTQECDDTEQEVTHAVKSATADAQVLLSRAHTMLRHAALNRDATNVATAKSSISDTVKTLHRESTLMKLQLTHIDAIGEDEMIRYLTDLKPKQNIEEIDSDFDTDLEDDFETTRAPESNLVVYEKSCRRLGVRPLQTIRAALARGCEVIVPHRMLNALEMLALTNALVDNRRVTKLVLNGNSIGDAGAQCLAWLLKDHGCSVQSVALCDNGIGSEGFEAIGEMLQQNRELKFLNLSGNYAADDNIETLATSLKANRQLQYLNLSHNKLGDVGARFVAGALAINEGLQCIDLSWNNIRPGGGVALFNSLKDNITLKSIQLAMNGVGTPGAMFIGDVLKQNETLTYINVTFNRIYDEGAAYIAKGLEKNEALHNLIIHDNPVTSMSAMALLRGIHSNQHTAMWKLDMSTVAVIQEAVVVADEINHRTGDFLFRYKGLVNCEVSMIGSDSNTLNVKNPLAMVKEYIENEGLRLIDFFKQMDKDHSGTISRDEFVVGLTNANVLMSQYQMDKLMEALDENGDGEIDYSELIEGDREYRRKQRQRRKIELEIIKGHVTDYFGYESKAY